MPNKKIILPLIAALALIMAVAGVFAMSAKKNVVVEKADTYYYHYKASGTSLTDYQNESNWESTTSPSAPGCSGTAKPCVVSSTESDVSDFVGSITSTSVVTNNTVAKKN